VTAIFVLPKTQKDPADEIKVAATIFPLYDIVKNIAGDQIEVVLILPAGASPHSFEPSPSLALKLQGTQAVYQIGRNLDDWAAPLAENAGAEVITVDQGIATMPSHDEDEGDAVDPHYWLTVHNAKIIAENIAADLSIRFPDQAETFTTNLVNYSTKLDELDSEIRTELKDLPNKNIVTFHDAWYYFSDEYGLNIAGTFEPTAGREPTAQYLIDLISEIQNHGVTTVYYEPQMSVNSVKNFAADYNIELRILDPVGGQAPYDSYINLIKTNVSTLQNNK